MSKSSHSSIRKTIRRTWGNNYAYMKIFPTLRLKFIFLVDIDLFSQRKVQLEYKLHKDIVQVVSIPEQYEYVTYREAAMYTFVHQRCKQIKFVLKTDDDIFLNLFPLFVPNTQFDFSSNSVNIALYGYPIEYGLVVRSSMDSVGERYVITEDEYLCPRYPTFLSGFAYLLSYKTCSLLLNAFQADPNPFPLSDVYFTGLLSQMMQIPRQIIFEDVDFLYKTPCNEEFFLTTGKQPFACAAANTHFNPQPFINTKNSMMNDYNLFWSTLKRRYNPLKI